MIKNRKAWIKRHGFTDGSWRLEQRSQVAKQNIERRQRNKHVAEPLRDALIWFVDSKAILEANQHNGTVDTDEEYAKGEKNDLR